LTHLLDTHSLIWFALDDPRLSVTARELIEDSANEVMISPASLWEIAIKVSIGKLSLNRPYKDFVDGCLKPDICLILPIEPDHVLGWPRCRSPRATEIRSTGS
jgi:PIN domain nuclease of toxin-antitoxin system